MRPQSICYKCGKSFLTKEALSKHIDSVHDLNEHPCKDCGKLLGSISTFNTMKAGFIPATELN